MSLTYNPNDVFLVQRNASSSSFVEKVLTAAPNSLFFFDSASNVVALSTSSFTASQAVSASWAPTPDTQHTASWAISASISTTALSSSYLNPGVNINLSQSFISSITGSSAPTWQPATLFWDDNAKTYAMYSDNPNVVLQIGQESWVRVYADEYIPNGAPVYVHSSISSLPCVALAIADGTGTKHEVIGLATENITSGSVGIITSHGQVHDLNTVAYDSGDELYLSHTESGSVTNTIPPNPFEKVIVGYVLNPNSGSGIIQVNVTDSPTTYLPFVGMTSVPSITSTGSSSFLIGTGSVNLCVTTDGSGVVKNYQLQSASFTLNTSSVFDTQHVVAIYNNGIPVYDLVTDYNLIDSIQTAVVYTLTPGAGGSISQVGHDAPGILLANKILNRIRTTQGIQRATGLILGVSSSFFATISSGSAWNGVNEVTLPAVNSTSSRFVFLGHSASLWSSSLTPRLTNTLCDNGTNVVALGSGNNHWVVNYIYRGIGSLNTSLVMYSNDFSSLVSAQTSSPPALPSELYEIVLLSGRVIYQKSVSTPVQTDSAYTSNFSPSGISNHNDLTVMDGGTTGEYYHLTSASYVQTLSGTSSYALNYHTVGLTDTKSFVDSSALSHSVHILNGLIVSWNVTP